MTTRRRFFAPRSSFDAGRQTVTLPPEETRHLRDVLRLSETDVVFIFDGEGNEYECSVSEVGRDFTTLHVVSKVSPPSSESPLQMTLAMALLKSDKFDLVIQKTTELGVQAIQPVATKFADVRLKDKSDTEHRVRRWQRIALEAAKQSGRAHVPIVTAPTELCQLFENTAINSSRLMFSERLGESFEVTVSEMDKPTSLVVLVGSEGGWADEELEQAREAGWKILTFSGRTLRAETAAITAIALLQHRFGDLK